MMRAAMSTVWVIKDLHWILRQWGTDCKGW